MAAATSTAPEPAISTSAQVPAISTTSSIISTSATSIQNAAPSVLPVSSSIAQAPAIQSTIAPPQVAPTSAILQNTTPEKQTSTEPAVVNSSSIPVVTTPQQLQSTPVIQTSPSNIVVSSTNGIPSTSNSPTPVIVPPAVAQSELIGTTSTHTTTGEHTAGPLYNSPAASATPTTLLPEGIGSSATSSAEPSTPAVPPVGVLVGAIAGGVALLGIISFLLWYVRKKRRDRRDSLLTPLTTPYPPDKSGYYGEIDQNLLHEKPRTSGFGNQIGTSVGYVISGFKARILRKASPSVNLNRGNSQFMEPVSQHSRSTSTVSGLGGQITIKDRFQDWWERLRADISFNQRLKNEPNAPNDLYASARNTTERIAANKAPDFPTFLDHQRRTSGGNKAIGSLDLDFGNSFQNQRQSPYDDHLRLQQPSLPVLSSATTNKQSANPFADLAPSVPFPAQQSFSSRARTSSFTLGATQLPAIAGSPNITSQTRYPSGISDAPSSNRSTYITTISDARSKKGRSDPFDLSPPDLSYLQHPMPDMPRQASNASPSKPKQPKPISNGPPSPLPPQGPTSKLLDDLQEFRNNRISAQELQRTATAASSDYEVSPITPVISSPVLGNSRSAPRQSGASSVYSKWGDPGPDLGPAAVRPSVQSSNIGCASPRNVGNAM